MQGGRSLEGVTPFEACGAETTTHNGGVHGVLTLAKLPITSDEPRRSMSTSLGRVPQQKGGDGCNISG